MLTRLLPDQVSRHWPIIKYAVEQSLPPTVGDHPDKMNRILSALLSTKADAWISYEKVDDSIRMEGVVLTRITHDEVSNTRGLLIYCLYGYNSVNNGSWREGLTSLAKYAKVNRCSRITAYTSSKYVVDLVNKLGGNTDYTFVSFDVEQIVRELDNLSEGQDESNN